MNYSEMDFSSKMKIVMETICYLRQSTGNTKVSHSDVERDSALYSGTNEIIRRQNWYAKDASEAWKAIRLAIDGELRADHPVEMQIAAYAKGDRAGLFVARFQKLSEENEKLRTELRKAEERYADLEKRTLEQRYIDGHYQVHFKKRETEINDLQKTLSGVEKAYIAAKTEADALRSDNRKYQKHASATGVAENPRHRLIEPTVSALVNVPDHELSHAYQEQVVDAFHKLLGLFDKSPTPKDVVFVFHAFNIDVPTFVRETVPFKYEDGNVVFACFLPNQEKRRSFFEKVAGRLAPFKPSTIIVSGRTRKASEVTGQGKVVNIGQKAADVAINDRLWNLTARHPLDYDVVEEGYDEVKIVRLTND